MDPNDLITWPPDVRMYPQADCRIFGVDHARSRNCIRAISLSDESEEWGLSRERFRKLSEMYHCLLETLDRKRDSYLGRDSYSSFLGEIQGLCKELIDTTTLLLRHCKEPGEIVRYCTSIARCNDCLSHFWKSLGHSGYAEAHLGTADKAYQIAMKHAKSLGFTNPDAIRAFAMFQKGQPALPKDSPGLLAEAVQSRSDRRRDSPLKKLFDRYFREF